MYFGNLTQSSKLVDFRSVDFHPLDASYCQKTTPKVIFFQKKLCLLPEKPDTQGFAGAFPGWDSA